MPSTPHLCTPFPHPENPILKQWSCVLSYLDFLTLACRKEVTTRSGARGLAEWLGSTRWLRRWGLSALVICHPRALACACVCIPTHRGRQAILVFVFSFSSFLLSYSSYTVELVHLKSTSQWFWCLPRAVQPSPQSLPERQSPSSQGEGPPSSAPGQTRADASERQAAKPAGTGELLAGGEA